MLHDAALWIDPDAEPLLVEAEQHILEEYEESDGLENQRRFRE